MLSLLLVVLFVAEPTIRMLILDTVAVLLEHHARLCLATDAENEMEYKERLFDVPIRMVSDINQQVYICSLSLSLSLSLSHTHTHTHTHTSFFLS